MWIFFDPVGSEIRLRWRGRMCASSARMRRVVLALGSNLGDREANLREAIAALCAEEVPVAACAPLYETAPWGGVPQAAYLNTAVLVYTALAAPVLLERGLRVERLLGRVRPDGVRFGPRTLDVDLAWIEGETYEDAELTVPHPRLTERSFVLKPLLDVAPDARDPRTHSAYAELPAAHEILRVYGPALRLRKP